MQDLQAMFSLQFMRNAFTAGLFLSILCPSIGLFLVLKRYSMIGDTLSHSSFAGVAIGLVIGYNPILTALVFTTICAVLIEFLRGYFKKYSELVMNIILTLSLGIAIILVSTGKTSVKVSSYLFGSILTVSPEDIILIIIASIVCLLILGILYKKLLYVTFDEEGARIAGINVKLINYLFTIVVGVTISMSIRIMGILVISSIIVIPVAAAMQFRQNFFKTMIISIILGIVDVFLGLMFSFRYDSAPGGTIALTTVVTLVIAIILGSILKSD